MVSVNLYGCTPTKLITTFYQIILYTISFFNTFVTKRIKRRRMLESYAIS